MADAGDERGRNDAACAGKQSQRQYREVILDPDPRGGSPQIQERQVGQKETEREHAVEEPHHNQLELRISHWLDAARSAVCGRDLALTPHHAFS